MLTLNEVNVFHGRIQALWDVSLRVEEGEIVAVIGANGAGKSTILNTICGIVSPASGTVTFIGTDITKMTPWQIVELGISHVPEGRRLFQEMSVRENLELGAYNRQAWKSRNETVEQIYQLFPILKERAEQSPTTLSGGEQQMLVIGRGLMSRPKLCMLDEPSYGLAPITMTNVFETIQALREQGTAILLVEQNTQRALEIADRAYVLESGRVVLEGRAKELLQNDHVRKAYLGL